jgi:hypothetical protein
MGIETWWILEKGHKGDGQGCSNQYGNLSFLHSNIFKGSPQWKNLISKLWERWEIIYKKREMNFSLGVKDAMHQSIQVPLQ